MTGPAKLGWGLAAMVVAGNMIGSGLYLLPATLAPIGSSSLVGWGLVTVGALALALVFSGLARSRPEADGLADYVEQELGRFPGYVAAVSYWTANWIGNAAIAVAAVGYLAVFFPVLSQTWPAALCNVALIWLMTGLYMVGPRAVARFGGLALAIGLVPIVIAVVAGGLAFDPALFAASWSPDGQPLGETVPASLVLIFWAFLGVESAGALSSRLSNPERDVGRATLVGVALAGVVYIAATVAVFGVIPTDRLAVSTSPFADLASVALGAMAATVVAACAIAKATGTLGGWIMVTGETARAAAGRGFLPAVFGTDQTTPRANPLIHAVIMSAVALLSAQPTLAGQIGVLISVTTVLFLAVYILCSLALLRFTQDWKLRLAAVAGIAFAGWATVATEPRLLAVAAGLLAVIALGWFAVKRPPPAPERPG